MLVLVELTVVFVTIALALPVRCRLSLPGRAARRQSWRKGTGGKCRSPAALLAKDAVPCGTRSHFTTRPALRSPRRPPCWARLSGAYGAGWLWSMRQCIVERVGYRGVCEQWFPISECLGSGISQYFVNVGDSSGGAMISTK